MGVDEEGDRFDACLLACFLILKRVRSPRDRTRRSSVVRGKISLKSLAGVVSSFPSFLAGAGTLVRSHTYPSSSLLWGHRTRAVPPSRLPFLGSID